MLCTCTGQDLRAHPGRRQEGRHRSVYAFRILIYISLALCIYTISSLWLTYTYTIHIHMHTLILIYLYRYQYRWDLADDRRYMLRDRHRLLQAKVVQPEGRMWDMYTCLRVCLDLAIYMFWCVQYSNIHYTTPYTLLSLYRRAWRVWSSHRCQKQPPINAQVEQV